MASLYVDLLSQPCRACALFCRLTSLPVEEVKVHLGKGEHQEPWYKEKNPLGKVPFYEEADGFGLAESAAILSYLAELHEDIVPDHWFPKDLKRRAKVNSVCHWYQTALRPGAAYTVRLLILKHGASATRMDFVDHYHQLLNDSLRVMDTHFLSDSPFLCGDMPSIADLLCACELDQLFWLDATPAGPYSKEILQPWGNVRAWMDRIHAFCGPQYKSVNESLQYVGKAIIAKRKRAKGMSKL
ncbi:hypothetical protein BSKO_08847 [Bryopsis sp. KO-2023]|nr:hypothetical protein BSKO_08847 [Bryopsis sp. KO-2023]